MMTPPQDLLDHAVDLFPAPEGSVADVHRCVARRHRNRRLGVGAVVVAVWVVIGLAASISRPDDAAPVRPSTPSPTIARATVHARGWPSMGRNRAGVYSWTPSDCGGDLGTTGGDLLYSCNLAWMHGGTTGNVAITVDGVLGHVQPHEGTSVTIFRYEGSHQRYPGHVYIRGGPRASCERWMVDIRDTTVTIRLCARPRASARELAEAHEIVESIKIMPTSPGFTLLLTLRTNTWDSG
jgi:hypothetical protein